MALEKLDDVTAVMRVEFEEEAAAGFPEAEPGSSSGRNQVSRLFLQPCRG